MQQNASKYGILRMRIFGSVARNEHTDVSDVDVYVEGQLHGFFALAGIKQDLEELLGCKVDIVRLRDKMDSFLREKILKEGIYVWYSDWLYYVNYKSKHPLCYAMSAYRYYFIIPYIPLHKGSRGTP